jgi:hypothetical protein
MALTMASYAATGDTAMITELKGNVTIDGKKAELLKMLKPGQTIKGGDNAAKVSISFFSDGHIDTLKGKFEAKIVNSTVTVTNGYGKDSKEVLKPLSGTLKPRAIEPAKPGAMNTRAFSAPPRIVNISPVDGELLTDTKPEFRWKRNNPSKYRLLILKNAATGREIPLDITEEGRLVFPGTTAPLEPGKWDCTFKRNKTNYDDVFDFDILVASEDDLTLVKDFEENALALLKANPDSTAPAISLISYYINQGLYHKAQKSLNELVKKDPANTYLRDIQTKIDDRLNKKWLK